MQNSYKFFAKRIYPSDEGLQIEFATVAEALSFYEDGLNRGITNNELRGLTVIKKFKTRSKTYLY